MFTPNGMHPNNSYKSTFYLEIFEMCTCIYIFMLCYIITSKPLLKTANIVANIKDFNSLKKVNLLFCQMHFKGKKKKHLL